MGDAGRLERVAAVLLNPRSPSARLMLGRALLVVSGAVVDTTIWSLGPVQRVGPVLAGVSTVMCAVIVLSLRESWLTLRPRAPLVFPMCVFAALAAIGAVDSSAAAPYAGLVILGIIYIGLTQPNGTTLCLVPLAAATWLADQNQWTAATAIRLAIAVAIWVIIGELLSFRGQQVAADRKILSAHANTDALTGVLNRRALNIALTHAQDGDTVIMCDLDHFKSLNDTKGHGAGDTALSRFGAVLCSALRGADTAGRYGGEEFVLILSQTSPEAALDVIARIRTQWSRLHPLTFSTGIAAISASTPAAAALAAADDALYVSKQAGRNCDHISYQQIVRAT